MRRFDSDWRPSDDHSILATGGLVAAEKPLRKRISLTLSAEQQRQIKDATGKDARTLELSIEELEERIAPFKVTNKA